MKKSAAEPTVIAAPAAPLHSFTAGDQVFCRHPGYPNPYQGKIVKLCNAEWFIVELPNLLRFYTHFKYVVAHTPDLLGDLDQAVANGDAREERADDSSEDEPHIISQWYISFLGAWCEQDHHEGDT